MTPTEPSRLVARIRKVRVKLFILLKVRQHVSSLFLFTNIVFFFVEDFCCLFFAFIVLFFDGWMVEVFCAAFQNVLFD
jgi:hypothetical protein